MFDSLRYSKAAIKSPKETAAPLETQGWCLYAAYQAPWYLRVTLRVIAAMNACSQTRNTSNASPSKQPGAESDANCWKNIPKDASALLNLSKKRNCAAWSLWNLMRWPLPTISTTNSVAKIAKFFSCPLGEYVLQKKRRGPDNYCLILFVGDRSIIYPVSLKMVRFPLRIAEQIKHTTIMNIRTYPYMMKPSCWVLQTVQDLKIWGIHWHRKRKKRPNTPWHLVLQICQGDSLGSAQLTKEDDESWRI